MPWHQRETRLGLILVTPRAEASVLRMLHSGYYGEKFIRGGSSPFVRRRCSCPCPRPGHLCDSVSGSGPSRPEQRSMAARCPCFWCDSVAGLLVTHSSALATRRHASRILLAGARLVISDGEARPARPSYHPEKING